MTDDLTVPERVYTAWEQEHLLDDRDDCLAFVTLDGEEVAVCDNCGRFSYQCRCCRFCAGVRPCACDEPWTRREYEAAQRRFYGDKEWSS